MSSENKLATLYVEVRAKTEQLQRDLELLKSKSAATANSMSTGFSGLSGTFAKLGFGILAVHTAFGFIKDSIKDARDAQIAFAQVEQAVRQTGASAGYTAGQIKRFANELEGIVSIDADTILKDVSLQLLTFGRIQGDVFKRAQVAVLDLSAVLESDLKSQSIQLGKALEDPIKGLTALSKAGITFTEQQKDNIKNLVQQNNLLGAQTIILDEIESKYGGQAKTLANTGGAYEKLQVIIGNISEKFGGTFLDVLNSAASLLINIIGDTEDVTTAQEDAIETTSLLSNEFDALSGRLIQLKDKTSLTSTENKLLKDTITALEEKFPNYIKNTDLSKTSYEETSIAIENARKQLDLYIQSVIASAVIQDMSSEVGKLGIELYKTQQAILDNSTALEKFKKTGKIIVNGIEVDTKDNANLSDNFYKQFKATDIILTNQVKQISNKINTITNNIKNAQDKFKNALSPTTNTSGTTGITPDGNVDKNISKYEKLNNVVSELSKKLETVKDVNIKTEIKIDLDKAKSEFDNYKKFLELYSTLNKVGIDAEIKTDITQDEIKKKEKEIQDKVVPVEIPAKPEIDFTAEEEQIIEFSKMIEESQISVNDLLYGGVMSFNESILSAFDTLWQGIRLSEEQSKNALIVGFVTMANIFVQQIERMIAEWLAFQAIKAAVNFFTGGIFGAVSSVASAASDGGTFQNGKKIASFANGGSFIVPPGFENDTFPILVESGERVSVTPSSVVSSNNDSALLQSIIGRLDALNMNIINKDTIVNINSSIDSLKFVRDVVQPGQNKLIRSGINSRDIK